MTFLQHCLRLVQFLKGKNGGGWEIMKHCHFTIWKEKNINIWPIPVSPIWSILCQSSAVMFRSNRNTSWTRKVIETPISFTKWMYVLYIVYILYEVAYRDRLTILRTASDDLIESNPTKYPDQHKEIILLMVTISQRYSIAKLKDSNSSVSRYLDYFT